MFLIWAKPQKHKEQFIRLNGSLSNVDMHLDSEEKLPIFPKEKQ